MSSSALVICDLTRSAIEHVNYVSRNLHGINLIACGNILSLVQPRLYVILQFQFQFIQQQ